MIVTGCCIKDIDGNYIETPEHFARHYLPALRDWVERRARVVDTRDRLMFDAEWEIERNRLMGVFSKALGAGPSGKPMSDFTDVDFCTKYPVLGVFMSSHVGDEGQPRQTSTLLLFVEQGACKACLKERDHALTLWVSATSILGVLEAMELALNESPPPWRSATPFGGTRRVKPS